MCAGTVFQPNPNSFPKLRFCAAVTFLLGRHAGKGIRQPDACNSRISRGRKNTGHRDDCHGGPLFPPERGQPAMTLARRKDDSSILCDKIVG